MIEIEYCYSNGDLARALELASHIVKRVGESNVLHVIARQDDEVKGAWWVDVIYTKQERP